MTKSLLAIIPARKGSKGLPNKNIRLLHGKPLINWTIDAAKASKYITDVVVTTDCEQVMLLAKEADVSLIKRPVNLALDDSPLIPVIRHALESLEQQGRQFKFVCLLQPTSPLRTTYHIDESIECLLNDELAKSLVSVRRQDSKCLKWFIDRNGYLEILASNRSFPFMSRQTLPNVCSPNGAIYIVDTQFFLEENLLMSKYCLAYYMSYEESIDIDNRDDLVEAEKHLKDLKEIK